MSETPHIIERAYQLARSGLYANAAQVELALSRENYTNVYGHMSGSSFRKELHALCKAAAKARAGAATQPGTGVEQQG